MFFLAKYGVALTFEAPMVTAGSTDFIGSAGWTPASGDVKVVKSGGNVANITDLPTAVGGSGAALWRWTLTATEMESARVTIQVIDSPSKAVHDNAFIILTYGHASAHIVADLSVANLAANLVQIGGDTQSGTDLKDFVDAGYDPATNKVEGVKLADTLTTYTGDTPQSGDAFARLGAPSGASVSADVLSLLNRLTSSRAGYLDNLNVGGAVASQADINALNQSASRRVILTTVGQYERPDSSSSTYTIEARTYDGDGVPTNADSTPTLAATGAVSGDLSANLGAATNPATGVYRWTYTVASGATLEQIRFDLSAVIGAATFPMAVYTQTTDAVSADFTTADRQKLTELHERATEARLAELDAGNIPADAAAAAASAATAATEAAGANTKAANIQTRIPAALESGRISAKLASDPPTAAQIDTQLSGTHGAGAWGSSSATGDYQVTVTVVDDDTDEPLFGAIVTVKTAAGTVHGQGAADEDGEFVIPANSGSWKVSVAALPGYTGVSNQAFTVAGADKAVEVRLAPIPATSVSAGTRVVRVILVSGAGVLTSGVVVTARLADIQNTIANAFVLTAQLTDTTDANGIADLTLITADQFESGTGEYVIEVPGAAEWRGSIPAGSGAYVLQLALAS